MASIRCEELFYDLTRDRPGLGDGTGNSTVLAIGAANTTTALTVSSAVVFGPAARQMNVYVECDGAAAYVTKGVSPVATAANSRRIKDGTYAQFTLAMGESLAAITATIA